MEHKMADFANAKKQCLPHILVWEPHFLAVPVHFEITRFSFLLYMYYKTWKLENEFWWENVFSATCFDVAADINVCGIQECVHASWQALVCYTFSTSWWVLATRIVQWYKIVFWFFKLKLASFGIKLLITHKYYLIAI